MRIRRRGLAAGALTLSPLLAARIALGAFGVWVASIGLRALLRGHPLAANAPVGRWLIGGVIAHDAVIAPTVFVLGAVTVRLAGPRTRQALAAILLIGGSVLIVGLPDVLRKGHNSNATVTPLDYTRNLIIVLLAVVGGVLIATVAPALRHRRHERRATVPLVPPGQGSETEQDTAMDEAEPEADADGVAVPAAEATADVPGTEVRAGVPGTEADAVRPSRPVPVDPDASADPRDAT